MRGERHAIEPDAIAEVLEDPHADDGRAARRRSGKRTIVVRYREDEDRIVVLGVSATRGRLPP